MDEPCGEPSKVTVVEDLVIVDGPGSVAITFTAEAALETSDRLGAAGVTALIHRVGKPPRAKR